MLALLNSFLTDFVVLLGKERDQMDFYSFSWHYLIPLPHSRQYALLTRDLERQNLSSKWAGAGSTASSQLQTTVGAHVGHPTLLSAGCRGWLWWTMNLHLLPLILNSVFFLDVPCPTLASQGFRCCCFDLWNYINAIN